MLLRFNRILIIVCIIILKVYYLSAQVGQDTIIYDFDNRIYKQTIKGKEIYYDLNGEIQNISNGNIKFDSAPIYKEMNRVLNFPLHYVDSGYGSTATVWFSLIIEPDGTTSNFRLLTAFNGKVKKSDFMPSEPDFPVVRPVSVNGELKRFEVVKEIVLSIPYIGKKNMKKVIYFELKEKKDSSKL